MLGHTGMAGKSIKHANNCIPQVYNIQEFDNRILRVIVLFPKIGTGITFCMGMRIGDTRVNMKKWQLNG